MMTALSAWTWIIATIPKPASGTRRRNIIAKKPTMRSFPSGDGAHFYFKGVKPSGSSKNSETGVEMYETADTSP